MEDIYQLQSIMEEDIVAEECLELNWEDMRCAVFLNDEWHR